MVTAVRQKQPESLVDSVPPIVSLPGKFEGRLVITLDEALDLVPLSKPTMQRMAAPGGLLAKYGAVVDTGDADDPESIRRVLISLPLLVQWSLGKKGRDESHARLEVENQQLRLRVAELERIQEMTFTQISGAASLIRGGLRSSER